MSFSWCDSRVTCVLHPHYICHVVATHVCCLQSISVHKLLVYSVDVFPNRWTTSLNFTAALQYHILRKMFRSLNMLEVLFFQAGCWFDHFWSRNMKNYILFMAELFSSHSSKQWHSFVGISVCNWPQAAATSLFTSVYSMYIIQYVFYMEDRFSLFCICLVELNLVVDMDSTQVSCL